MEGGNDTTPDIISNLPKNVLECVLEHLPIRDAVRTSLLSRKWRNNWRTIPQLVFDDQCISVPSNNYRLMYNKLVRFIDRALLVHRGPIQKFKISVSFLLSCPDIDQWILYLSYVDIKEFSLELEEREWYRVPSSLFDCQQLTHLKLFRCELLPPPIFNGFKNLKNLNLQQSFYENEDLENLIASCPVLESVTLTYFNALCIKICALRLKYLRLEGELKEICIENAPLLTSISIAVYMTDEIAEYLEELTTSNMMKALGSVPLLERLVAESYFVKYLSIGLLPIVFPIKFSHLRQIELLQVGFEDMDEIAVAICFLVNSPNLEQLLISASSDDALGCSGNIDFWETHHPLDCSFNQLHTVKMTDITGVSNELEFIKFILAKSPILKTMRIKPSVFVVEGGWGMLMELLQFPRVSPHAGITYVQA